MSPRSDLEDLDFDAAFKRSRANAARRSYPGAEDARYRDGLILPALAPRFSLNLGAGKSVFTIGSCFARNVEEALAAEGVTLPTLNFAVPKSEWKWPRANGILNEFNPGTIAARISGAMSGAHSDAGTLVEGADGISDLLLAGGQGVLMERAVARRAEIFDLYAHLPRAEAVIITLGYIETWFDAELQTYLNRMPHPNLARKSGTRYRYRRLGVSASLDLLHPAIEAMTSRGIKVLLSVSPVPLQTTFEDADCMVANEYSKSVLRVVAEELWRAHPLVDYIPTYESIRTTGLAAYDADHVHVNGDVVATEIAHMLAAYRA